jgi:hypothetical protein
VGSAPLFVAVVSGDIGLAVEAIALAVETLLIADAENHGADDRMRHAAQAALTIPSALIDANA